MDVERTIEFILEQQAAHQARTEADFSEMRANQIQLQKAQLAQEAAHAENSKQLAAMVQENAMSRKFLAEMMLNMVENLDKASKEVDKTTKDVGRVSKEVDRVSKEVDRVSKEVENTSKDVARLSLRVDDFIRKTDERFARLEHDVDGLQGRN